MIGDPVGFISEDVWLGQAQAGSGLSQTQQMVVYTIAENGLYKNQYE